MSGTATCCSTIRCRCATRIDRCSACRALLRFFGQFEFGVAVRLATIDGFERAVAVARRQVEFVLGIFRIDVDRAGPVFGRLRRRRSPPRATRRNRVPRSCRRSTAARSWNRHGRSRPPRRSLLRLARTICQRQVRGCSSSCPRRVLALGILCLFVDLRGPEFKSRNTRRQDVRRTGEILRGPAGGGGAFVAPAHPRRADGRLG